MLYIPWRNEDEDLNTDAMSKYITHYEEIIRRSQEYMYVKGGAEKVYDGKMISAKTISSAPNRPLYGPLSVTPETALP